MTRVSFDIDPSVLSKLRALANRRGVTVDIIVSELLGAAIRTPGVGRRRSNENPQPDSQRADPSVRPAFGLIDVDYPDSGD